MSQLGGCGIIIACDASCAGQGVLLCISHSHHHLAVCMVTGLHFLEASWMPPVPVLPLPQV
jgi:hypothetical protein